MNYVAMNSSVHNNMFALTLGWGVYSSGHGQVTIQSHGRHSHFQMCSLVFALLEEAAVPMTKVQTKANVLKMEALSDSRVIDGVDHGVQP